MSETGEAFDLAIIGAGINGAGIARDASLRGLSVVVFEKSDIASGTSAASSRLIHGGLRYLEYGEIPLVYESLHERSTLLRIAPHLVRPLRITIPIYKGAKRGRLLIRLGMLAYDLLSFGKELPQHDMPGRDEMLKIVPGLQSEGLMGGARYFDAQVAFAERLVLENMLAASAAGASVRIWQRVTKLSVRDHSVQELHWHNEITNERGACSARLVINAAGPWLDQVLETAAGERMPLIGGTKGSHIVVSAFAGAPEDAFYVEATADGRPIFILPWNGLFLVGTTDIRFDGSPDEVCASDAEIDYLLQETNRVFPRAGLTRRDIHYAYAGVRPLPRKKGPESAITRKHIILQHHDYAKNLISIIGGKLTTYRHLAEQAVDRVVTILGADLPACSTKAIRLPGGQGLDEARLAVEKLGTLSGQGVERLLAIYGGRAVLLAELAATTAGLNAALDEEKTILAAEVIFAIRHEFALRLTDIIYRRMMIGLSAEQGRGSYARVAELAANELDWNLAKAATELKSLYALSDSLRLN